MKLVLVENISNLGNLRILFLKKYKSSLIKFVILIAQLPKQNLQNENFLCYTLRFGKKNMNDPKNAHILYATIE